MQRYKYVLKEKVFLDYVDDNGLTFAQFGDRVACSASSISRYAAGEGASRATADRVACNIGMRTEELWTITKNENTYHVKKRIAQLAEDEREKAQALKEAKPLPVRRASEL